MADPIDIYVDLLALQQLANKLQQIRDALDHTNQDLESFGPALGSSKVSGGLHEFVHGWTDGRKKIEESVEALVGKVQGAARTYQEQEDALARSSKGRP